MTDVQTDVLNQITELLKEHFEASVLCVQYEANDDECMSCRYTGGFMAAIGMADAAHQLMLNAKCESMELKDVNDEEDNDE